MRRKNPLTLPLLDYLAYRAGCMVLSDLCWLTDIGREALAKEAARLRPEDADLSEWNAALVYLTGQPAAATAEQARADLLVGLLQDRKQVGKGEQGK